jgi:hypothetical protein
VPTRRLVAPVLLVLLSSGAFGWNDTGHQSIALLTYRELPEGVRTKVTELLKQHPSYEAWVKDVPAGERDVQAFMMAAAWPDAIRKTPEDLPADHYINFPYAPAGASVPEGKTREAVLAKRSVLTHLKESVRVLKDDPDQMRRAKELCWLLHLVGDLHQPLHTTALFSDRLPEGDRGGNALVVAPRDTTLKPGTERLPNLHLYWDGLLGSNQSLGYLSETADRCAKHTRKELENELQKRSVLEWAEEGYQLAVKEAYQEGSLPFLTETDVRERLRQGKAVEVPALPVDYERRAEATAERRAALAAYRLVDLLTETLK